MVHEISHALFSTRDYAYYGDVPSWVQSHPSEKLDNADSYRLFAEHEYLH
jgi:hypothetical protein